MPWKMPLIPVFSLDIKASLSSSHVVMYVYIMNGKCEGGPHNHTITALAVALKQAASDDFKVYQTQVLHNCQAFALRLLERGYKLVSDGTDNHLLVLDLRNKNIDGARVEKVMDLCNIAVNKNTVPGDANAIAPKGIRMGTPAMTSRGFKEKDFKHVADLVDSCVQIAQNIMKENPGKCR